MAERISLIDMHCHLNYLPQLMRLRQRFAGPKLNLEQILRECEKRNEKVVLGIALYSISSWFGGKDVANLIDELKNDMERIGKGKIKLIQRKSDLKKDFVVGIFIQVEVANNLNCFNQDLEKFKREGVLGIIPVLQFDNPYGKKCLSLRKKFISNDQGGLSQEGYYFLERINQLGLWIDLTHMTDRMAKEAGQFFAGKILCSTTAPRRLINCHRNISEHTEDTIKLKNGIIGITPSKRLIGHCDSSLKNVIHYYQDRGLLKHVCLGTDFGHAFGPIKKVHCLFSLKDQIRKILDEDGKNSTLSNQICSKNAVRWLEQALN